MTKKELIKEAKLRGYDYLRFCIVSKKKETYNQRYDCHFRNAYFGEFTFCCGLMIEISNLKEWSDDEFDFQI
jgi:hypothetical protein